MKLRYPELTLDAAVAEFDFWVTPSLSDVRESRRYRDEMRRVRTVLESLKEVADEISPEEVRKVPFGEMIADRCLALVIQKVQGLDPADAQALALSGLDALAATLFLVTGKSDNNAKCQFPLHLRAQLGWETLPALRRKGGVVVFLDQPIPRVIKSVDYMARIASLLTMGEIEARAAQRDVARALLCQFVGFVLADDNSRDQFWSIVRSYFELIRLGGRPEALLAALVAFQVRGSVSASGGHEPEETLRARMAEWGLQRDVDFNVADVVLDVEAGRLLELSIPDAEEQPEGTGGGTRKKTRAYDFVLPFRTAGWSPRIFVQSQFYAGDSGSVSHKNVDQTSTSRRNATALVARAWPESPPPRFIEYVDGAGYSASLNGDLRQLLSMNDTQGFTQVRSSPIRLRREFQQIGFLTPLELEHALLRVRGAAAAMAILEGEGYSRPEIERCIERSVALGVVVRDVRGELVVAPARLTLARCYLLLDVIARNSGEFSGIAMLKGVVLVPGYGPYFGIKLDTLGDIIDHEYRGIWDSVPSFTKDLMWLCEKGFAVQR